MYPTDTTDERPRRQPYAEPLVETIVTHAPLSILELVSLEGEIQDFQDGEDF